MRHLLRRIGRSVGCTLGPSARHNRFDALAAFFALLLLLLQLFGLFNALLFGLDARQAFLLFAFNFLSLFFLAPQTLFFVALSGFLENNSEPGKNMTK